VAEDDSRGSTVAVMEPGHWAPGLLWTFSSPMAAMALLYPSTVLVGVSNQLREAPARRLRRDLSRAPLLKCNRGCPGKPRDPRPPASGCLAQVAEADALRQRTRAH
jgi:hypothetical protein